MIVSDSQTMKKIQWKHMPVYLVVVSAISVAVASSVSADPGYTPSATELQYLESLQGTLLTSLSNMQLVGLGNQACGGMRSGSSADDVKVDLAEMLVRYGARISLADTGSLVHNAVVYLCPDVNYS